MQLIIKSKYRLVKWALTFLKLNTTIIGFETFHKTNLFNLFNFKEIFHILIMLDFISFFESAFTPYPRIPSKIISRI